LSQQELGGRAGLSAHGISDLERGARTRPYPATSRRLAHALGLSEADANALYSSARPPHGPHLEGSTHPTTAGGLPVSPSSFIGRNQEVAGGRRQPEQSRPLTLVDIGEISETRLSQRGERSNLPAHRPSLIGRDDAAAAVRERLIEANAGLLTLTGAGGCGKTSLAVHVARDLLELFPDGVWLVEFAPLSEPALVDQAVAAILGVRKGSGRSVREGLVAFLRPRVSLLLLDNCEHLVDACARLTDALLGACPELRILATSREPLRTPGEVTWRVPSLQTPDPRRLLPRDELAGYAAVRLFVERAQAVRPGFALGPENATAIARVCARLDGLPLALELAAARTRALTVGQIAERLDGSLRLLTDGSRTAPTRQQTLEATLDWSHDLLTVLEQAVFRRLGVFSGGWDLEAAEAVCADDGIERADVLDLLTRLVDKSLVLAEEQAGEARYRLLEPIRQYALEQVTALGEANGARSRHAEHYLWLAEQAAAALWGPHTTGPFGRAAQVAWHTRLERDHDNLRAALAWTDEQGQTETLARWFVALWGFWFLRGHLDECRQWVEVVLARGRRLGAALRARLLGPAGWFARQSGDYTGAVRTFEEALALFRSVDDEWNAGAMLNQLGITVGYLGDSLGARRRLEESLAVFRALDEPWGIGFGLLNLAEVLRSSGDVAEARALLEEGLPLLQQSGDIFLVLESLIELGGLALEGAQLDRTASFAREGLPLLRDSGMRWYLSEALELAAGLAAAQGRPAQAARLLGAAETAREITGQALQTQGEHTHSQTLRAARAALDADAFGIAWDAGRRLSLEQAIDEALAAAEYPPKPEPATVPVGLAGPLTPREWEVAQLITQGLTNSQIAEDLVISRRTADRHVSNILNKLGFATRSQIIAWISERRILTAEVR
jgi:predicted ATPase/DNA-binding CsgD family transcriptional regulator/transcriptional regulator with XRE-family HTH domain